MAFNCNYFSTPTKNLHMDANLRWVRPEIHQKYRGEFSKDRDRILYSKSFLRLRGKTQVFMLQNNDYIRTRITHTLEVNQIAKTIAIALGQNIELVEAIALGHDVGHTPFGHIGERTLRDILEKDDDTPPQKKGFKHNLQALRLLCELEQGADYPDIKGLNLTKYVLWGIAHHSSIKRLLDQYGNVINEETIETENPIYDDYLNSIKNYWSFEGFVVALADEIAQRHHDIEDSLQYGILTRQNIIDELDKFKGLFNAADKKTFKKLQDDIDSMSNSVFVSVYSRLMVNMYVVNVITQTRNNLRALCIEYDIKSQSDFANVKSTIPENVYKKVVSFSDEFKHIDDSFQKFLKTSVLSSYSAQAMDGKGEYIIRQLYSAFLKNPTQLPDSVIASICEYLGKSFGREGREIFKNEVDEDKKVANREGKDYTRDFKVILQRCIIDYIGGMTDRYAYDEYDRLYGTKF